MLLLLVTTNATFNPSVAHLSSTVTLPIRGERSYRRTAPSGCQSKQTANGSSAAYGAVTKPGIVIYQLLCRVSCSAMRALLWGRGLCTKAVDCESPVCDGEYGLIHANARLSGTDDDHHGVFHCIMARFLGLQSMSHARTDGPTSAVNLHIGEWRGNCSTVRERDPPGAGSSWFQLRLRFGTEAVR